MSPSDQPLGLDEKDNLVSHEYFQLRELSGSASVVTVPEVRRYSVDEAVRNIGLGWYHLKWIPIIAISAFTQSSMIALAPLLMTSLKCQWNLETPHQVLILFVLFFGTFPGDIVAGVLADKKGRKLPLILGQLLLLTFSVLSTASFNFIFFSVCYFFIGVAIGMLTLTTVVLLSEMSPPCFRSYSMTLFLLSWVLGALFSCIVSYSLLNKQGWEIVTFVVAVPHVIVSILVLLVDESPKYLAISGQIARAEQVLGRMALQNNVELEIEGKLDMIVENHMGSLGEVVAPEYRKQLALLSLCFGFVGVIIYSSYTMIPHMLEDNYCYYTNSTTVTTEKCHFPVSMLKETAMITISEIIMLPIFAFVNELFGRIKTLRVLALILFVSSFFLVFCFGGTVFVSSLYLQRGGAQSLLLILLIYTPESFPTHIRGVGCGLAVVFLFLGGLISTTLVYPVGVLYGFSHLAIALAIAALAILVSVMFLDTETRGNDLP